MSLHRCIYNGGVRFLLATDDQLPPTVPVWSLINYLSLNDEGGIPDPKVAKRREDDPNRMLARLITRAFKANEVVPPRDTQWRNLMGQNYITPNHTGNPFQFTREPNEFIVDTLVFSLCELLGIRLCHAWIQDPHAEGPDNAIGERGLTHYGLEYLQNEIREGELAMLFRDGIPNVLRKENGSLFLLETNKAILGEYPEAMWRLLTMDAHQEMLFTYLFTPLELHNQPNAQDPIVVEYMRRWDEGQARLLQATVDMIEGKESKKPPKNKKARNRKKHVQDHGSSSENIKTGDKLGDVQDHGSTSDNKESTSAQGAEVPAADHVDDKDGYKWVKDNFKDLLERFEDPDDDATERMPFYRRMVEGWKNLKAKNIPYTARIYFPHIQRHDNHLALAIQNDGTRLNHVLSQVFLDFRVNLECGSKEELNGKVKVRIIGMPPAGSTCRFEEFIKSNKTKLAEPKKLFGKKSIVNSTTYIGRIAGKGYVDDLIENHKNGNSWNGNISMSDLGIKDGKFVILTTPTFHADCGSMRADLLKLTELLFKLYKTDALDESPAYFDAFQSEVFDMHDLDVNSREFKVFQRYLSHHPAFKAPLVRAGLFIDVWGVIQSLRAIQKNGRRASFQRLQAVWKGVNENFHQSFIPGWFFDKVYRHDNTGTNDRYCDCTLLLLLELIRHLEMHLHDHTRNAKGEQLLEDTMLIDLMIEKTFSASAAKLVHMMMLELDDAPFSRSWEKYQMIECGDNLKITVSECGKGKELQSPGVVKHGAKNSDSANSEAKGIESSTSGCGDAKHDSGSVGGKGMECSTSKTGVVKHGAKNSDSANSEAKGIESSTSGCGDAKHDSGSVEGKGIESSTSGCGDAKHDSGSVGGKGIECSISKTGVVKHGAKNSDSANSEAKGIESSTSGCAEAEHDSGSVEGKGSATETRCLE